MKPLPIEQVFQPTTIWSGQDAFLIGGGPSLRGFDFNQLRGRNTIGTNYAYRLGPDIVKWVCFSDSNWFNQVLHELERYANAGGNVLSVSTSLQSYNLPWLNKMNRIRDGLHLHDGFIGWNFTTGAVAVNLALYFGAKRIFLLGYDMGTNEKKSTHWHNYYAQLPDENTFQRHIAGFATLYNAIVKAFPGEPRVFNVTNGTSRLPLVPCVSFEEFQKVLTIPTPDPVLEAPIETPLPPARPKKVGLISRITTRKRKAK